MSHDSEQHTSGVHFTGLLEDCVNLGQEVDSNEANDTDQDTEEEDAHDHNLPREGHLQLPDFV
jgi:hypothetical protein